MGEPGIPALRLFSDGLLSKWGFNDGDIPDDVLDYCEEHGLGWRIPWHPVLEKLVRERLVPALDQQVTVVRIETIHNPIRAQTVDGADAERFWTAHDGLPQLTPEYVEIPMAEVMRAVAEEMAGER